MHPLTVRHTCTYILRGLWCNKGVTEPLCKGYKCNSPTNPLPLAQQHTVVSDLNNNHIREEAMLFSGPLTQHWGEECGVGGSNDTISTPQHQPQLH